MRDLDVRRALRRDLQVAFRDQPGTLIVNELELCQGATRVDLAVINGSINGYEIKSERDTLERLPTQQTAYNRALDTVTVVAARRHVDQVMAMVPIWWGITEAVERKGKVSLTPLRVSTQNPSLDPIALTQLLWRDELLTALQDLGLAEGLQRSPRPILRGVLAKNVTIEILTHIVRTCLKARTWRSGSPRRPDGGSSQSAARLSHSRTFRVPAHTR